MSIVIIGTVAFQNRFMYGLYIANVILIAQTDTICNQYGKLTCIIFTWVSYGFTYNMVL